MQPKHVMDMLLEDKFLNDYLMTTEVNCKVYKDKLHANCTFSPCRNNISYVASTLVFIYLF